MPYFPPAVSGPIVGPSVLLQRAGNTTIEDGSANFFVWDALVDPITYAPVLAIPAGLGLDFDWDDTNAYITATEDCVIAYSFSGYPPEDATAFLYGGLFGVDVVDFYLPDMTTALWGGYLSWNISSTIPLNQGDVFRAFVRPRRTPTANPYIVGGTVNLLLTRVS